MIFVLNLTIKWKINASQLKSYLYKQSFSLPFVTLSSASASMLESRFKRNLAKKSTSTFLYVAIKIYRERSKIKADNRQCIPYLNVQPNENQNGKIVW